MLTFMGPEAVVFRELTKPQYVLPQFRKKACIQKGFVFRVSLSFS